MPLTHEEVAHIARLARLSLTDAELETYRVQLSAILDHVAQLAALDTTGIQPTAGMPADASGLRVDDPRPGLPVEALKSNAPDWENGQFRIPPIFE